MINIEKLQLKKTVQSFTITPKRGSIYSKDGSLLASSSTSYNIYFDAVTVSKSNFKKYINPLSQALSETLDKSFDFYFNSLKTSKDLNRRYHLIARGISISELNEIKKMPLFKMGGVRGGLIVEKKELQGISFK